MLGQDQPCHEGPEPLPAAQPSRLFSIHETRTKVCVWGVCSTSFCSARATPLGLVCFRFCFGFALRFCAIQNCVLDRPRNSDSPAPPGLTARESITTFVTTRSRCRAASRARLRRTGAAQDDARRGRLTAGRREQLFTMLNCATARARLSCGTVQHAVSGVRCAVHPIARAPRVRLPS